MNHVLNIPVEVQQKSLWCWAAVSTMAVKSFSNDSVLKKMTQFRTKALQMKDVRTKSKLAANRSAVKIAEEKTKDPNRFNTTGVPWLFEVNYTQVTAGNKLSKQTLIDEILAGRPVIVMWDYTKVSPSAGNFPSSKHYLIVTGYNDVTEEFRVFDPWPTPGEETGEPEEHEHNVTYAGYGNPEVSLGLPVSAVHESECYDLRRMVSNADIVPSNPPAVDIEPVGESQDIVLRNVDFGEILKVDNDIQAIAHRRIVYAHSGSEVAGTKRAGEVFPIVGLTTRQILGTHGEPHRLLVQKTWALMVPVTVGADGRAVDSFQMYRTREGWKEGGHSNTRIVNLMIRAAERLRREANAEGRIYLVSIPEQVMFFAACGEGPTAKLISLDDDAKGPVLGGKAALDRVRKFIDRQREDPGDEAPGSRD